MSPENDQYTFITFKEFDDDKFPSIHDYLEKNPTLIRIR